jgi:hypothetical protein
VEKSLTHLTSEEKRHTERPRVAAGEERDVSKEHQVENGDHLSGIAEKYGFGDFKTIWDLPENAELRGARRNPHVLLPGDKVAVPDKTEKMEQVAADKRHRFQTRIQPLKLRIRLLDLAEQPAAGVKCRVAAGPVAQDLVSDGEGKVERRIPRDVRKGKLTVDDPDNRFDVVVPVLIGELHPVDTPSGQRARLRNLGYYFGDLDEDDPPQFKSAVEEFQCDHGLPITGDCDAGTQSKLLTLHGA